MAELWHAISGNVWVLPATAPLSLLDVTQSPSGTKVVRAYRIWHFDSEQRRSPSAGVITKFVVARIGATGEVGGTRGAMLRPARSSYALPSEITAGSHRHYAATPLASEEIIRQYSRSCNTVAPAGVTTIDTWEMDVPMALVFESGLMSASLEPVVVRPNQAIHVRQESTSGNSVWPMLTIEIEFTVGNT